MAVITISRQIGSGGDEIVNRLCQVLGYQQFDKRLIIQAAAESGLSEQEASAIRFDDFTDENHKVTTFLDRLFNRNVVVFQGRVWKDPTLGGDAYEDVRLSEEAVVALVEHAIRSAYTLGNFVIVGRAGQVILKDKPDAIHIRIDAPMEDRIQRVKAQFRQERQAYDATSISAARRRIGSTSAMRLPPIICAAFTTRAGMTPALPPGDQHRQGEHRPGGRNHHPPGAGAAVKRPAGLLSGRVSISG
jgi:cytidylate kinase